MLLGDKYPISKGTSQYPHDGRLSPLREGHIGRRERGHFAICLAMFGTSFAYRTNANMSMSGSLRRNGEPRAVHEFQRVESLAKDEILTSFLVRDRFGRDAHFNPSTISDRNRHVVCT